MIKVLHLFASYLPPTEVWAYQLIRNTPEIEVHIGAQEYLKNNFYPADFHIIEHFQGELKKYNRSLGKKRLSNLPKKGVVKMLSWILGNALDKITKYGKEQKLEIVHAHFGNIGWHFRQVPEKMKTPFVVSFYGWDYQMLPHTQPQYKAYYRQLFAQADRLLCEGENGARLLEQLGCPAEKIRIVRLGIDAQNIPFYQRDKTKNQLRLIQLASFTEKKGQLYTIEAFAKARKKYPNLQLTLVGNNREPAYREKVMESIKKHQLEDKIEVLDGIDFSQLYSFFKNFDVFIHPSCHTSQMDCEGGAPIVLLDAQATGMPVISTKHCDIPDEVIHGQTGLLVEEKTVDPLVSAIGTFYEMEAAEFSQYASAARAHVLEHYNLEKNGKVLLSIYQELIEKK